MRARFAGNGHARRVLAQGWSSTLDSLAAYFAKR